MEREYTSSRISVFNLSLLRIILSANILVLELAVVRLVRLPRASLANIDPAFCNFCMSMSDASPGSFWIMTAYSCAVKVENSGSSNFMEDVEV